MIVRAGLAMAAAAALVASGDEPPASGILVDQIGYETDGPKHAIVVAADDAPQRWTLIDATGAVVASGDTVPAGLDPSSGKTVQQIAFDGVHRRGTDYRLTIGTRRSAPFAIADRPFAAAASAALNFFYQQRSGQPIEARFVTRPDLARPAGHPRDVATCFAGHDPRGVRWPGCDYRLDVTGGWYDAGDHGKYVVNGGIATWTLLDIGERLASRASADTLEDARVPGVAPGAGIDTLLAEARVEVEFLLAMQVPDGQRLTVAFRTDTGRPASDFRTIDAGGLVHTKVADVAWTGIPTAPADDRMRRFLYPPSTAATLNMVAIAAQAARIWRHRDPAFAARALAAAQRGWAAARRVPDLRASSDFTGSGGYGDAQLADERFWAAAALFATTGDPSLGETVAASSFLRGDGVDFGWGDTALPGVMTLAMLDDPRAAPIAARARARIVVAADRLLSERQRSGYRLPYAGSRFEWGSNATLLNRAMLLGAAWQITRRPAFRDAVVDVADYVFGRNALDRSYVTGFGARTVHQPHHRFWAHAADPRYPAPPPGVIVGGPNSSAGVDDPVLKGRCVGQTCWRDDWRAFTMNEVAINWNAPLVWVTAFLDATRGQARPSARMR